MLLIGRSKVGNFSIDCIVIDIYCNVDPNFCCQMGREEKSVLSIYKERMKKTTKLFHLL